MTNNWHPTATEKLLNLRASLLIQIRKFMAERKVLEVETPILSWTTVTDPNIESFKTSFQHPGKNEKIELYLQTSPEYAMKRLLAAGIGPIYQVAKVFRNNEIGTYHHPEFSLLEWYQPDYDHYDMMQEVEELTTLLGFSECARKSYHEVFEKYIGINPHDASVEQLSNMASNFGLISQTDEPSELLDYIFCEKITSHLGQNKPTFIYDYPVCQSALAKLRDGEFQVAERFELYISGIEIANGFNELCNATEQKKRFEKNKEYRKKRGMKNYDIDENFIAALENGLQSCAGVAIGIDRLLMLIAECDDINQTLAFSLDRA